MSATIVNTKRKMKDSKKEKMQGGKRIRKTHQQQRTILLWAYCCCHLLSCHDWLFVVSSSSSSSSPSSSASPSSYYQQYDTNQPQQNQYQQQYQQQQYSSSMYPSDGSFPPPPPPPDDDNNDADNRENQWGTPETDIGQQQQQNDWSTTTMNDNDNDVFNTGFEEVLEEGGKVVNVDEDIQEQKKDDKMNDDTEENTKEEEEDRYRRGFKESDERINQRERSRSLPPRRSDRRMTNDGYRRRPFDDDNDGDEDNYPPRRRRPYFRDGDDDNDENMPRARRRPYFRDEDEVSEEENGPRGGRFSRRKKEEPKKAKRSFFSFRKGQEDEEDEDDNDNREQWQERRERNWDDRNERRDERRRYDDVERRRGPPQRPIRPTDSSKNDERRTLNRPTGDSTLTHPKSAAATANIDAAHTEKTPINYRFPSTDLDDEEDMRRKRSASPRKDAVTQYMSTKRGSISVRMSSALVGFSVGGFVGKSLMNNPKPLSYILSTLFLLIGFLRNDYGELSRALGLALILTIRRTTSVRKRYPTAPHLKALLRAAQRTPFPPIENDDEKENPWRYQPIYNDDPDFRMPYAVIAMVMVGAIAGGNIHLPLFPTWIGGIGGAALLAFATVSTGSSRGDLARTMGMRVVSLAEEAMNINSDLRVFHKVGVVGGLVLDKMLILDRKHRIKDRIVRGFSWIYDKASNTAAQVQADMKEQRD